ncbi:N4-gp56 family major capsid protein [Lentzea sp. E54]|uniref:N4-gp56 family major capsid protein n=1 Tax=Lentzea xerophila TaxID=3435883 RepID=UPI003DA4F7A9
MADVKTDTTVWADFVQTAFDTTVGWYLNDMPLFRNIADKKPVSQAMPSNVVTLSLHGQLAANATPLTEGVDPDAVAMPDARQLNVTLLEYGNVVMSTEKLTKVAFTQTVLQDISQEIASNMGESLDLVYKTVLDGATNKLWQNTSTGAFSTTDLTTNTGVLSAKSVAAAGSLLERRKVQRRDGANWLAYVHPDCGFDLKVEVGGNAWLNPHQYVDTANIYAGEIGTFHGTRFVSTPRATIVAGTPNQYNTYFFGREALVEAVATEPGVRVGPKVDKLQRFQPIGWYGLLGASIYRQNANQIVRSISTLDGVGGTPAANA